MNAGAGLRQEVNATFLVYDIASDLCIMPVKCADRGVP